MSEIEKARKTRSSHRRSATKAVNNATEILKSGAGSSRGLDRKKLQLLITELGEKRADLKQIDDEILELLHDTN